PLPPPPTKLARAFVTAAAVCAVALPYLVHPRAPAHSFSSGAPASFSGPEQYCNYCHGGVDENPVNSGTGYVTIIAPDTFEPGEVIPVTVAIYNTTVQQGPQQRQGFELAARDANLDYVGSFNVDGTTVQFAPGAPSEDWVTHTSTSNADTSWTFEWVAPTTDVPATVTLYAAGNAADGDFSPDADDKIYSAEHVLTRIPIANEPGAAPLAFRLDAPFPNPVRTAATARYTLERPAEVEARLVDGRGRVVRVLERGARGAGVHTLRLAADGLPAGAYFLTLSTPEG